MKDDFVNDVATMLGLAGWGLLCHAAWAYDPLLGEAAIGLALVLSYIANQQRRW